MWSHRESLKGVFLLLRGLPVVITHVSALLDPEGVQGAQIPVPPQFLNIM